MIAATTIAIDRKEIGGANRCYVIAEAGVNHNGDLNIAKELVDAAVEAGADAVKFQTFSADRLAAPSAARAPYQASGDKNGGQYEMLKKLELSASDHDHLFRHATARGITFLSTPFDRQSADLLADLGVAAFKIGSGDLTDRFLLARVAKFGRPVLLSTGGSTLAEVGAALDVLRDNGNPPTALLHCVSTYPAKVEGINLRAMDTLLRAFPIPVGFSDHTEDLLAPVMAVSMGASLLEKHMTLARTMSGPDHGFSLEPTDFGKLVAEIRRVEGALGDGRKEPLPEEKPIMDVARKSLFAARRIEADSTIGEADLIALRPANGLSPMEAHRLIGHVARQTVEAGQMMQLDMVHLERADPP